MRLWTLNPCHLDRSGLVALWREALLAQAVLGGRTRGYTRHPQLVRFRDSPSPIESIGFYLQAVHAEAAVRGYRFDAAKIISPVQVTPIPVTSGQLEYEWAHLNSKLRTRAPSWAAKLGAATAPTPHPLFQLVEGPVADWEVVRPMPAARRPWR
jgi:hypothetical protein